MRDYVYQGESGPPCLVAEMSTADIHEALLFGFELDGEDEAENIVERLRIELIIRSLGLSAVR